MINTTVKTIMSIAIQSIGKYISKKYKKLRGDKLVPEGHLVIIEEDGQAIRLEGPGYVRTRLYEEFGPLIPFGSQAPVELSLDEVRSADGDTFGIRVRVRYGFEPKRCNLKETPQLVRNAPAVQTAILQDYGAQVVRSIVGKFKSPELRSGRILSELEGEIQRQLYRAVRFAGIILYGVAVTKIIPPRGWDTALSAAKENEIKIERTIHEKRVLAEATAQEKRVLAEAMAHEKEVLAEPIAQERQRLVNILAAIDSELAERVINAEILGKFADNAGSVNFVSAVADPFNRIPLAPWLTHPVTVSNGSNRKNGGDSNPY